MRWPYRPFANISAKSISSVAIALAIVSMRAFAGEWAEAKPVMYRGEIAMTYRATLAGDWLIVEAKHNPEWHSYAMDNVQRAKKASGKETPETELPTRIAVSGGLKTVGAWKQSPPKDLSKSDIQWYSWGFTDTARFAVKVERTPGAEAAITINGQSCNATSCSMVRDVRIAIPAAMKAGDAAEAAKLIEGLVDVLPDK